MDDSRLEHDDDGLEAPRKKSSSARSGASRKKSEEPDSSPATNLTSVDAGKALEVIKQLAFGKRDNEPAVIPPGKTSFFDLQYNFAAALCYFPLGLSILAPALWLYSEPRDNEYIRFHSIQALIMTGAVFIFLTITGTISNILNFIPFLGIFSMLVSLLGGFVTFAYMFMCVKQMLAVYQGKRGRLPLISELADQWV
jgi:uncharacterized membrane protein